MEPRYNEVFGTIKITLLYQVSHYIRVKKQRNIKSWDQLNHLVIRGFCYIRPLYNEVPLYNDEELKHTAFFFLLIGKFGDALKFCTYIVRRRLLYDTKACLT